MIKFEERFVHCFWNDELEGKKGFFADTMGGLKDTVESNDKDWFGKIYKNPNNSQISYPFGFEEFNGIKNCYQFCYYDPLYEMKVAYEEGKTIQHLSKLTDEWVDCECRPLWNGDSTEYRIKPTEEEYQVVISFDAQGLAIVELGKDYRKVLFKGTEKECEQWVKDNYHLQIVIDGYFEDEPIVYKEKGVKNDPWKETKELPYNWDFDHYEYRIATHKEFLKKVHSKEYVPFENTQELIEAWEKKYPTNKDRPNGTMPLIWIKLKENENNTSLITDFGDYGVSTSSIIMSFDSLFEKYTFADGSVCGKKEE